VIKIDIYIIHIFLFKLNPGKCIFWRKYLANMNSNPLTMRLVEYGGNDTEPMTIIISDTEIHRLYRNNERYLLFKVDTAFRLDEIAHGTAYSQTMPSRTMQPLTLNDLSGISICAGLYPGSGGKATECEKYIAEVKYRREKNDRIAALEAEVKIAERELKVKYTPVKETYNHLEREIEELRKHVSAIIWDKEDLQRSLLQSSETIQALKRDIDKEQSLARQLRDDNRELRCKVRKLAVQCQTRDSETLRDSKLEIEELKQKIVNLESQPTIVAVPITACECSDLKAQVQSLKLQLATEKRISQKYARDLQEKEKQQTVLTAM